MPRIVLAYSGSRDTSLAIPWLTGTHAAEVVTVTMDLGGPGRELEAARDRALAAGAVRAHVLDLKDEFARDYILPALKADAASGTRRWLTAALGRPLIARKLVEVAGIEQATTVAHGASGHDRRSLEGMIRMLNPQLHVLAAAHQPALSGAEQLAAPHRQDDGDPTPADRALRVDANLWGRSIAGAGSQALAKRCTLTKASADCPDEAAYVELSFSSGIPTAINGVTMPLVDLIGSLNTIAGAHGVGRTGVDEPAPIGNASWAITEAPAAAVLEAAHVTLQQSITGKDLDRVCRLVRREYADVILDGLWFTPLRRALDAFVASVQEHVSGAIRLKLFKGELTVVSHVAPSAAASDVGLPIDRPALQSAESGGKKMRVAR